MRVGVSLPGPFYASVNPGRAIGKGVDGIALLILAPFYLLLMGIYALVFLVWLLAAAVYVLAAIFKFVGRVAGPVLRILWELLLLPFRCLWWLAQVTWDGVKWGTPRAAHGVATVVTMVAALVQDWQHRNDTVTATEPWAAPVVPPGWTDEADEAA